MKILQDALLYTLRNSINIPMQESFEPLRRAISSKITLDSRTFIIVANKALLKQFAVVFLNEKNPSDEMIGDISREFSNVVVGRAKVAHEDGGEVLKLGIPEYLGHRQIRRYISGFHYAFSNMRCSIYEVEK